MSRGASITLGVVSLLCGICFCFVPAMGVGASVIGMYLLGAFCCLIAMACLIPRSRPVTLRLIAFAVFASCVEYVWGTRNAAWWPTQRGQPSLARAVFALLIFGLPAACVAVRGAYPWWGRGAEAFGAESLDRVAARSKPIVLSWRKIPEDAKFILQGHRIERAEWEAINGEVNARLRDDRPALFRRVAAQAGAMFILVAGIVAVPALKWPAFVVVVAVVAAIAWYVIWLTIGMKNGRVVCREVMSERGHPICVGCGYNLQGTGALGPSPNAAGDAMRELRHDQATGLRFAA